MWELLIIDIKPWEINVKFKVNSQLRGSNIDFQRYRGMTGMITKLMPREGTYNLQGHIVLGLEGD